jgi:hypothetical protein
MADEHRLSHPDLFHLCDCLHPPPGVTHRSHYPLCIYTCVLFLSIASSSCLSSQPLTSGLSSCCSQSLFLTLLGLPLACSDSEPACLPLTCKVAPPLDYWPPLTLTAVNTVAPPLVYWPLPALTCLLPAPVGLLNHCQFDVVCIWVYQTTKKHSVLPWFSPLQ